MERAAETGDAVSYSGVKSFYAARGGRTMAAVLEIEARTGQGSQINVRSQTGQQLLEGFSPAAISSRVVDDELLTLLEHNYTLAGIDSAYVAGRAATMVAASRQAGSRRAGGSTRTPGWCCGRRPTTGTGRRAVLRVHLGRHQPVGGDARPPAAAACRATTTTSRTFPTPRASAVRLVLPARLAGLVPGPAAQRPGRRPARRAPGLQRRADHRRRLRATGPACGRRPRSQLGRCSAGVRVPRRLGIATWQSGDLVFTVVTDGPAEVLARAVAALPRRAGRARRLRWTASRRAGSRFWPTEG